ncbi:hypothetical protein [Sphingomonas sp. 22176]|uniref:hypothetical protein n=1 Tax=Sphingomonas sp. 22176 TaxID=3453884 RepID=UPI003F85F24A
MTEGAHRVELRVHHDALDPGAVRQRGIFDRPLREQRRERERLGAQRMLARRIDKGRKAPPTAMDGDDRP